MGVAWHGIIKPMELAYHYTTVETFLKILDNSICRNQGERLKDFIFWASSIYAMNDPQELIHGFHLLWNKELHIIEKDLKIPKDENRISSIWKDEKNKRTDDEQNQTLLNELYESHQVPFVISFSKHRDSLPMWNTYAHDSLGISLGFENNEYIISHNNNGVFDVDMNYKLHAIDVNYGDFEDITRNFLRQEK